MRLGTSRCSSALAAVAAAALSIALSPEESGLVALAFAPPAARVGNRMAAVKGREAGSSMSSTVAPEAVTKSSPNKSRSKSKQKKQQRKNGKKPRVVVKNAPNNRGKGGAVKKRSKGGAPKSFKPLKDLKLGSKVSGTVVDVCDFGAFISIGYNTRGSRAGTALLHISQIKDEKISNLRDVIKVGDTIDGARVINIDLKKGEVGLSLRASRPKRRDFAKLKVGDKIEGKVDSVVPYGAFVDVGTNVNALLHISRITGGAIENVRHHVNEGDPVSVHVIDIDKEKKTMAVSMLDKKADQYLDRRMSQRLKRFYGTAAGTAPATSTNGEDKTSSKNELDYFDEAIRELEEALKDRET
ncbi:hypothetical protein ACHAXT_000857 [Thalassiosira profunda]